MRGWSSSREARTGRTYAIPFGTVWEALVTLGERLPRGWRIVDRNEGSGVIEAQVRGLILPLLTRVVISVGLDANAQTRVDVRAQRRWGVDLGATTRRSRRLLRALDRFLAAQSHGVLDPPATERFPAAVKS